MASDAAGIGARLRAGRERLNLSVLQAAERLHVDPHILESLEGEDFTALGAPVYARGHLRRYADLVGESVPQLSELLSRAELEGQPDLTRIVKAPPSIESSKLILPALFVLAVFAVAGAVWWVLSLAPQQPIPTNELSTPPQNADRVSPAGSAPGAASPANRPGAGAIPPHAAVGTTHLASAGGSLTLPSGAPGAAVSAPAADKSSAEALPGTAQAPAPDAAPHRSREQQVTLRYSADCWTEVYDSSGQRLFYDVGAAGSTRTLKGLAPLRVVLANAAGVAVDVDGHGTSIAKMAKADGSAEFLVNRSGRVARPRPLSSGD